MIVKLTRARASSFVGLKHYTDCNIKIGAPLDQFGMPVTGLKPEDEARLEKELDFPAGTLGRNSAFWHDFHVLITADTTLLNTSNPEDELKYMFLKAQKKVAKTLADARTNSDCIIVMFAEEEEAKTVVKSLRSKREAYRLLTQMTPEEIRQILRQYGNFRTDSTSDDVLEAALTQRLEDDPDKFLVIVQDPKLKMKVFIDDLVRADILTRKDLAIMYNEGVLGYDIDSAVAYLEDKNNQPLMKTLKELYKTKRGI